jgi:hypothetical protein
MLKTLQSSVYNRIPVAATKPDVHKIVGLFAFMVCRMIFMLDW